LTILFEKYFLVMAVIVHTVVVMAAVYRTVSRRAAVSVAVMSVGEANAGYRQRDYSRKNYLFHINPLLLMSVSVMTGTVTATVVAVVSAVMLSAMLMGSALDTVAYRAGGIRRKGFAVMVVGTAVIVVMPRIAYAVMVMGGLNRAIRHRIRDGAPDIGKHNGAVFSVRMGKPVITARHCRQRKYAARKNR
jgi:hypothetical protein